MDVKRGEQLNLPQQHHMTPPNNPPLYGVYLRLVRVDVLVIVWLLKSTVTITHTGAV